MTPDFALIETMRAENGRIPLLPLHRDRLRASAAFFGFPYDDQAFERVVAGMLPACAGLYRFRLTLDADGRLEVTAAPYRDDPVAFSPVTFAETRIDPEDPFFRHKTTRRAVYERAYARARAGGFGEALLCNVAGEVTEGTRTNVFARFDDRLVTPPVRCGLLGGVYRRHLLLTRPDTEEAVLRPDDLHAADQLLLCNAVAGLAPVELAV